MGKILDSLSIFLPVLSKTEIYLIVLAFVILNFAIALFIYNDSKNRGGKSIGWVISSILLGGIIPLIFYLMVRSPYTLDEIREDNERKEVLSLQKKYYQLMISKEVYKCPVCGEEVKSDYLFCPHCFTQLRKKCPKCGAIIEKDAKICPYCGFIFEGKE